MEFDYDAHLARQVEEYYRDKLLYSNCCDEELQDDEHTCPKCYEPCEQVTEEDREYDRRCDVADAKYEQQRDERNE